MYTCVLAINVKKNQDWWIFKEIHLPFVPRKDVGINLAETDGESTLFDEVTIQSVEWSVALSRFYCECVIHHGKFTDDEFVKMMEERGWKEKEN